MFVGGDENSAWSRRFSDLIIGHINDLAVGDRLSEAQVSLIKRCASIECELERLDAQLSQDEPVDLDAYARVSGQLRRLLETLHTVDLGRHQKDISPFAELAQPIAYETNAGDNA